MDIATGIYDTLKGLVEDRVFPDEAPQGAPTPFIVFRMTSQEVIGTIHGTTVATIDTYAVDVWDDTRSKTLALVDQVRTAMQDSALNSEYLGLVWGADVEMGFEGCSVDFRIINA